jgi:hypothetical protein
MWHDGPGASDRLHLSIRFALKLYPTWSVKTVPMTLLSIPGMDLQGEGHRFLYKEPAFLKILACMSRPSTNKLYQLRNFSFEVIHLFQI